MIDAGHGTAAAEDDLAARSLAFGRRLGPDVLARTIALLRERHSPELTEAGRVQRVIAYGPDDRHRAHVPRRAPTHIVLSGHNHYSPALSFGSDLRDDALAAPLASFVGARSASSQALPASAIDSAGIR